MRIRRDEAEREASPENGELLKTEHAAGFGSVERDWSSGDELGGAIESARGGNVKVPEGGVHGRPQVRHFLLKPCDATGVFPSICNVKLGLLLRNVNPAEH